MRLHNQIADLIIRGKLSEALNLLEKVASTKSNEEICHISILYKSQLNDLKERKRRDLIDNNYFQIRKNQISSQLLDSAKDLEKDIGESRRDFDGLVTDPDITANFLKNLPEKWHQRSLYIGIDGGNNWLSLVNEYEYQSSASVSGIRNLILKTLTVKELDFSTLVSFGPGDAEIDKLIISEKQQPIMYIPVDISEGLLYKAFQRIRKIASIPFGILGDFEEGFKFIADRLNSIVAPNILIALTGNTIGNVDRFEKHLLTNIEKLLTSKDYLLLQVAITGQNWKYENDFWVDRKNHTHVMRRFFAYGAARKGIYPVEKILSNYEELISVEINEQSDIRRAKSLNFKISNSEKKAIKLLSIRRYDWPTFLDWLKEEFSELEILREQHFFDSNDETGSGCVLLRKK